MTPIRAPRKLGTTMMEGSLDLTIRIDPLAEPSLAHDYLQGLGAAPAFYGPPHADLDSFRQKLVEVATRFGRPERELAARALRPTSERARDRLTRFVHEGGAVVTTGQQAGLFTGPLYTIYKALTAVRLAEVLEGDLGVPVLPVFWIASDDHDWDEVNHAFLLDGDGIRRIDLPTADRRPVSMSRRTLTAAIDVTLDDAADVLAGHRYAARYIELARGAYRPGVTVAAAFEAMLAELLKPYDLLITDAADPAIKSASAGVITGALEHAAAQEELLRARTEALLQAGYHAQVPVLERGTNVFYHGAGPRERLYRDRGGVVGAETGTRMSLFDAVAEVRESPGEFSPNVFLRPVVESAVFPTLAYIGGPGEVSYFGQLSPLFEEFGMSPPVVYPRASITLVEEGLERRMEGLGLAAADLRRPRHELVESLARRAMPKDVRDSLARLSRGVSGGYKDLIETAKSLDPTLAGALGSIRNESMSRIGRAERKILRRLKELEGERVRELDRIRARLAPGGQPQERVLNVLSFLARYGPELLAGVAESIRPGWKARVG